MSLAVARCAPATMGGCPAAATGSATSRSRPACREATVDRVLHGRPGVSARAVRAVEAAVLELDRQQSQLRLSRRTLLVDVVIDAPRRFSGCRARRDRGRPAADPTRHRPGPLHDERGRRRPRSSPPRSMPWAPAGRVSHGLVLKAPDHPAVAEAVRRAARARHPDRHAGHRRERLGPGGLRRPRQRGGRRDGGLPDHPRCSARPAGAVLATLATAPSSGSRSATTPFRERLAAADAGPRQS